MIWRSEYRFNIVKLIKQSRPGFKNPQVLLKAYAVYRRLCVYTVLTEYLKRTYKYRKQHQQLILSYMKPFKHVTSYTIARWIKICLAKSGIDVDLYTAHIVFVPLQCRKLKIKVYR